MTETITFIMPECRKSDTAIFLEECQEALMNCLTNGSNEWILVKTKNEISNS